MNPTQAMLPLALLVSAAFAVLPPPLAAAQPQSAQPEDPWRRARALADRGSHGEALAVVREALKARPHDDGLMWLEAGITGEAGRHAESVRLYEALLARHPGLAPRVRTDLAAERLWSGDPRGALRDLDQRLAEDPTDVRASHLRALALAHADRHREALAAYDSLRVSRPNDLDVALERAMVLGWMGRHRDAEAAYSEVLAKHPENARARLGLAQNENWSGRHRLAAKRFRTLADEGSTDPEVWKGLAYAEYWAGRPEASRAALARYLERRTDDGEAIELATMLARDESPSLTTGHGRSDDSDGLRVVTTTLEYRLPIAATRAVSLHFQREDVRDGIGQREPLRAGIRLERVWSESWSAQASAWWYRPDTNDPSVGLGEGSLTWRPQDRTRLEIGFGREPVTTPLALENGIRTNVGVAQLAWQAHDRLALIFTQRLNWYSDDNRSSRRSVEARLLAHASRLARVTLLATFDRLETELDLDNGYYDPERYDELGPGVALEWTPRERWRLGGQVRTGWQKEWDVERDPYVSYVVSAGIPIGTGLGLNLEGGRSDSNLSTVSGFRRRFWAASLTARL